MEIPKNQIVRYEGSQITDSLGVLGQVFLLGGGYSQEGLDTVG